MSGSKSLTILMPGLLSDEFRAAAVPNSRLHGILAGPVKASSLAGDYESALAARFGLLSPLPAVALRWHRQFPGTPLPPKTLAVELVSMDAGARGLTLTPLDADPLSEDEAHALDVTIQPLLADWFEPPAVIHHSPGLWFVSPVDTADITMPDTAIAMERGVDAAMPAGNGSRLWVGRLSESQIALYEHSVNTAREARGGALASSLWFSKDTGELASPANEAPTTVISADPRATLLANWAGAGTGTLHSLPDTPESGETLVVDSGRTGASVLDWVLASIEWLKHDQISALDLIDPEAGRQRFERATGLRRWWLNCLNRAGR